MAVSDGEVREDSGGGGGGARLVRATFANVQAAVVDVFATFIDMQMACRDMQVVCRCFPDPLKIPTRKMGTPKFRAALGMGVDRLRLVLCQVRQTAGIARLRRV